MVDFKGSPRRWARRLFGDRKTGEGLHAGAPNVADGLTALALVEAALADAVVFGAAYPATVARGRLADIAAQEPVNLWDRPVDRIEARSPREAMARAMGLALSGTRTTVFLSQDDLLTVNDLLGRAVARRLPLVIHAVGSAGLTVLPVARTGEDGLHAAAQAGAGVRIVASVQEAVDAAVILRRASEDALCPMVLAVDGRAIALSVQDFLFPDADFLRAYVGDPGGAVHAATPSQELVLGRHRARVPKWHDPQRPMMTGSLAGSHEAALAAAGSLAYHEPHMAALFEAASAEFARETGRAHPATTSYRIDDAGVILVAPAGLEEFLEAAVDRVRTHRKLKAGLIAIHGVRPFPYEEIAGLLRGKERVVVLEGTLGGSGSPAPLVREITALLDPKQRPQVVSALAAAGLGSLRGTDVDALLQTSSDSPRPLVLAGVSFSPPGTGDPKRDVLLSTLRRQYPHAEALGVAGPAGDLIDPDSQEFTLAIQRLAGHGGEALAGDVAGLLSELAGGHVRTNISPGWERWGAVFTDRLVHSHGPVRDSGPDVRMDLVLWVADGVRPPATLARSAREGTVLIVPHAQGVSSVRETLAPEIVHEIATKQLKLYMVRPFETGDATVRDERRLGACLSVLHKEGRFTSSPRKILAAREAMLGGLPPAARQARLTEFRAGFDAAMPVETTGLAVARILPVTDEPEVPAPVRRIRRTDEVVDSLPRFWDQVGVFYRRGDAGKLTPDPYLATGVLPVLSAAFGDHSGAACEIPVFDPGPCTGCGACWSVCPDGALAPLAIHPTQLIESGMTLAKEAGRPADALRMVASKLAGAMSDAITVSANPPSTAEKLLDDAFGRLLKKTAVSEERRTALTDALAGLKDAVGRLPVARTEPFFDKAEVDAKGSGTLFTLAIHLEACKACGLCVEACEPAALAMQYRDEFRARSAAQLWNLVATLPATPESVLAGAAGHPTVGPVAAALLDRDARYTFTGGDSGEPGSGEKIALRQVLAVAQRERKAVRKALLEEVATLRDRLSAEIRESMAKALPVGDLDALKDGLQAMERPDVDLGELSARMETAFDSGRVDVVRLQRLVETAKEVGNLHWRLESGEGGLGQAPYSLVLGPGSPAAWAAIFPQNPFAVPVTVAVEGETADLARGLLEGQIRQTAQEAGILRRARLELEDPKEAGRRAEHPVALHPRDLTRAEKQLAPPLFVVLSESAAGGDWAGLDALLEQEHPVVILVLQDDPLGFDESSLPSRPGDPVGRTGIEFAWAAAAAGRAFAAQTSFAAPEHLARSTRRALAQAGPALLVVHAPSPSRHGFARDGARARAATAIASRTFPLFTMDPDDPAMIVDLDGNPDPGTLWVRTEAGRELTPADWALGEGRYEHVFGDVDESAGDPVSLSEYLELSKEDRVEKIPCITDPSGRLRAVGETLLDAAEHRVRVWNLLRSRMGYEGRAAEPATLPAADVLVGATAASSAVAPGTPAADQIEAALASVRASYEARMVDLRMDLARQVRGRLLTLLARQGTGNGGRSENP